MDSIGLSGCRVFARPPGAASAVHHRRCVHQLPCTLAHQILPQPRSSCFSRRPLHSPDGLAGRHTPFVVFANASGMTNSTPVERRSGIYTVGDFMTKKEDLHVVKTTTTVDEALETLVDKRITGFPVIDDDWKLVGVVSDYDLLALDSISVCPMLLPQFIPKDEGKFFGRKILWLLAIGRGQVDTNLFPDVDSSWKTFNEIQKLLIKTYGKVVGDLMTSAPLAVRETTNLEDAVRLLLETKYRRLPVVDSDGRLVGILTRGNVVKAALQIKRANEGYHN